MHLNAQRTSYWKIRMGRGNKTFQDCNEWFSFFHMHDAEYACYTFLFLWSVQSTLLCILCNSLLWPDWVVYVPAKICAYVARYINYMQSAFQVQRGGHYLSELDSFLNLNDINSLLFQLVTQLCRDLICHDDFPFFFLKISQKIYITLTFQHLLEQTDKDLSEP